MISKAFTPLDAYTPLGQRVCDEIDRDLTRSLRRVWRKHRRSVRWSEFRAIVTDVLPFRQKIQPFDDCPNASITGRQRSKTS